MPYHYGMWNYSAEFGYFWMPGDFSFWSPALVSWYTGPGWMGWAPLGLNPRAGLLRPVTTVSSSAFQAGQLVTPETVNHVDFKEAIVAEHPPSQPAAGAAIRGIPLAEGFATLTSAHPTGAHAAAPSSILMGVEGGKESALLGGHALREPLRYRLGTTLGGRYTVGGTIGEFKGDAFERSGSKGMMNGMPASAASHAGGPSILPHGHSAQSPRAEGGEVPQGGNSVGIPSASSPAAATPASSSHSTSPSAGGAGHH
jgi:hypothetical protein